MTRAEYARRRTDLERREATLAQREGTSDPDASRAGAVQGFVDSATAFATRVRSGLDTATFERKRHLVALLIDRVAVTGDDVGIRYAFPIGPAGSVICDQTISMTHFSFGFAAVKSRSRTFDDTGRRPESVVRTSRFTALARRPSALIAFATC